MTDKILAIARHEWPEYEWTHYHGEVVTADSHVENLHFDPLSNWSDLMPLVVKHKIEITDYHINTVGQWVTCWAANENDKFGAQLILGEKRNLSEQEYRRVAIEALYQLIDNTQEAKP